MGTTAVMPGTMIARSTPRMTIDACRMSSQTTAIMPCQRGKLRVAWLAANATA
jgi:hypothetical protein